MKAMIDTKALEIISLEAVALRPSVGAVGHCYGSVGAQGNGREYYRLEQLLLLGCFEQICHPFTDKMLQIFITMTELHIYFLKAPLRRYI